MCPNLQETEDLVTFTEEILNGKPHPLWSLIIAGLPKFTEEISRGNVWADEVRRFFLLFS